MKQTPRAGLNRRQKLTLAAMDLLLIVELTACMFFGSRDPDTMVASFLRAYVPLFVITLGGGLFLTRRFKTVPPEA